MAQTTRLFVAVNSVCKLHFLHLLRSLKLFKHCRWLAETLFLANVLRYVRYMLSAVRLLSVVCLSVCLSVCLLSVCDVGAPYSGG